MLTLWDWQESLQLTFSFTPFTELDQKVNEINIDELPEKFVLKCNHGSGMNIFCKEKSNFNLKSAKLLLKKWLNINYGLKMMEYQYINIERKIFAEQYLVDEMINYKFYCFNGEPKLIRVKERINRTYKNIYQVKYHEYHKLLLIK